MLPSLPMDIRDRFQKPLSTGDQVLYCSELPLVFTIQRAQHAMDPAAPPGIVMLTLTCQIQLGLLGHVPAQNLVLVSSASHGSHGSHGSPFEKVVA